MAGDVGKGRWQKADTHFVNLCPLQLVLKLFPFSTVTDGMVVSN